LACGAPADNSRVNLPPPVESSTVGPGDLFRLEIVGEKDLPTEYQVATDGSVDLPYVHRLKVQGLEPHEISALVRNELIKRQVLTDPTVIVMVKEYNSKRFSVLGQIQKPGSFPFSAGMTVIQAISLAGGLNSIANKDQVNLTRITKGGTRTVVISVDAILSGRSPDIPLQAGDRIYVLERIF
jgi:polysaccharide export outer membrane protein